jgi:hypothetical protein
MNEEFNKRYIGKSNIHIYYCNWYEKVILGGHYLIKTLNNDENIGTAFWDNEKIDFFHCGNLKMTYVTTLNNITEILFIRTNREFLNLGYINKYIEKIPDKKNETQQFREDLLEYMRPTRTKCDQKDFDEALFNFLESENEIEKYDNVLKNIFNSYEQNEK